MRLFIIIIYLLIPVLSFAQDVVPKAKTKAERKEELKKMTLKERIEDALPVEIGSSGASLNNPKIPSAESIEKSMDDARKYMKETVPDYGKELKEKAKTYAKEAKKMQAKIFDGKNYKNLAVKKVTWRQKGNPNTRRYLEFYVLKDTQQPLSYRRSSTWYELKTAKISEALSKDTKTNVLLHGPYKEFRGNNLVKEGSYYLGSKDGRWLEYDKDFILLNKEYFDKGFYRDSKISYYDNDSSKIKEIIPVQFDKITGKYYKFYESGVLEEEGEYESGKKIKVWIEYYDGGNRRKKVTQNPNTYDDETEPYVLTEYDENRKVIYEYKKNP